MKILIIIPAFNEEKNILNVIRDLKSENNVWNLLVVNDNSEDDTKKYVDSIDGVDLINLDVNLGIGGAVQTGFKFAKENNYDIAVQFDGDGQHIAKEINRLIEPILMNSTDVVIGSRFLKENDGFKSTKTRRAGIKIFEILNSILIGQKITDNTSGFRAFNRKAVEFLSENYPEDYPEPESAILLGKNGLKILEVPVNMSERKNGKSSISGILSVYYMVEVLLAIIMESLRKKIR